MAKYKKKPQEVKAESRWDWLLQESERAYRERGAYTEACKLDDGGNHEQADEVLRAAGIAENLIADRRRHINWRISVGKPAIGE